MAGDTAKTLTRALVPILIFALGACGAQPPTTATTLGGTGPGLRVLVFTKTTGFRHASIADGVAAIHRLGQDNGFAVDDTADAGRITDAGLTSYRAVVFLSTTGDILDDTQQAALRRYIQRGGGWVGIHAAADAEAAWPWYGGLLGTRFRNHPAIQRATIRVTPGTADVGGVLPARWERTDEWYNFRSNPRAHALVLATLDENSYQGGLMGADHPIAWCRDYDGGRAWYTAGGHTSASFAERAFLAHLLAGLRYATGASRARCGPEPR
jgi:type 1 glutamine amidotransferase